MNVEQMLDIPPGELDFVYPNDSPQDRTDPRFKTLRAPHSGLRLWDSFEEDPPELRKFWKHPTEYPETWRPTVQKWTRYLGSETSLVDLLKATLLLRVNYVLNIIFPGVTIIGTPRHFPSYGTDDNRLEGAPEALIGSDLPTVDGDLNLPPDLKDLQDHVLNPGEAKVKHPDLTRNRDKFLPGTLGCYEAWLAQAVQSCIDLDLPLGWLVTTMEVVFFHVLRCDDYPSQENQRLTRSSKQSTLQLESLPSDGPQEPEFSSPIVRLTNHWKRFNDGDGEIPYVHHIIGESREFTTPKRGGHRVYDSPQTPLASISLRPSPLSRKRTRPATAEESTTSQESIQAPITPTPNPQIASDGFTETTFPFSSSQFGTVSPSDFDEDPRAKDVTHVLVISYPLTDRKIGRRLLEFVILAKRAKDLGVLKIDNYKLSHSALSALEDSRRF